MALEVSLLQVTHRGIAVVNPAGARKSSETHMQQKPRMKRLR
jgi:hypothetical protein